MCPSPPPPARDSASPPTGPRREFPPRPFGGPSGEPSGGPGVRPGPDGEVGPYGLTWGQWRAVAAALPAEPRRGRRADTDLAAVVAALLHQRRSRCPWRRLPAGFPPWPTVYSYRRRWQKSGALRAVLAAADAGAARGS